jgi:hypothetical protein
MTDRPTPDEIREALRWLESAVTLVYDGPNEARVRTALTLARRGAARMAADEGTTREALGIVDGVLYSYREGTGTAMTPKELRTIRDALLARIDPETETTDDD